MSDYVEIVGIAESPGRAGFDPARLRRAYAVIERFVERREIPGAVAAVGTSAWMLPPAAFGSASWEPEERPVHAGTIYDCASLTKVVVTTTLLLNLVERGRVALGDRVARWIPELLELAPERSVGGRPERSVREGITIRHLLTHTAGFAAWAPLYQGPERGVQQVAGVHEPAGTRVPAGVERPACAPGPSGVLEALCRAPLQSEPSTAVVYSCLGFILLGELIEREEGAPLDRLAEREIFVPLGMRDSCFNPRPELLPRIAPTERKQDGLVHGVVHDENARARGGVSGNAGLFSTAGDLGRFAAAALRLRLGRPAPVLSPAAMRAAVQNYTEGLGEPRGLGWLLRSRTGSSCGDFFSAASFGHTGFTGTSIWIDPEQDLFVVLLTNRVHPTRENAAHLRLRPLFHNAVAAARDFA